MMISVCVFVSEKMPGFVIYYTCDSRSVRIYGQSWTEKLVAEDECLVASILVAHIHFLGQATERPVLGKRGVSPSNINRGIRKGRTGPEGGEAYTQLSEISIECGENGSNDRSFLPKKIARRLKLGDLDVVHTDGPIVSNSRGAIKIEVKYLHRKPPEVLVHEPHILRDVRRVWRRGLWN